MGKKSTRAPTAGRSQSSTYHTAGGVRIERCEERLPMGDAIESLIDSLDTRRGAVYASCCEVPGRYARWDRGFIDPPLVIEACARNVVVRALNDRGRVLRAGIGDALAGSPFEAWKTAGASSDDELALSVPPATGSFPEERRSRQPSVFSLLRALH